MIEGDPHGEAVRPNMLFAVSHAEDLLSPERRQAVVLAATRDLLTPFGLRTLSPRDSFYHGRYDTSKPLLEKDQAYHQGAVWPWPWLMGFMLSRPEGSLPEVFDGGDVIGALASFSLEDPAGLAGAFAGLATDQRPGGTRSQAWSVAEAVRVLTSRLILAF